MLAAEFMQKPTLLVSSNDTIRSTITKLLAIGSSGAVVHEKNVVVGAISEGIILSHLYPSQKEFIDNPVMHDFEELESNMKRILSMKVKDFMRTNISDSLIYPSTSIIHVLSVMSNYGFSHLPVVNQKNEIVGMIHQRDIFKALIGSETPFTTSAAYHDWTARFYDLVYTQTDRYKQEVDSLIELFKKNNVKNVLDIGFGTGTHATLLAKAGFNVVGIEKSIMPYKLAHKERLSMSPSVQNKLQFAYNDDIISFLEKSAGAYDAMLLMGNMLSHYPDWKEIINTCVQTVNSPGLIIIESVNSKKILKRQSGFLNTTTSHSKIADSRIYSFTQFYDRPWKDEKYLLYNMSVLRFDGTHWTNESINSAKVRDFKEHDITMALKQAAGKKHPKKIEVFGSVYAEELFKNQYDVEKHDWFTHVALC